jgi:hypothetical protein
MVLQNRKVEILADIQQPPGQDRLLGLGIFEALARKADLERNDMW